MIGVVFVPSLAKASFLASLFGDSASASTDISNSTSNAGQDGQDSQNDMALQVTSSPFNDQGQDNTASTINEGANAFEAHTGPLGVSDSSAVDTTSPDQVSVYVVKKGDSLSDIATMFNVSTNTILLANDMKKGDKLTEGQVLIILPITGIQVTVKKGDTLQSIARANKADISDIEQYNGITADTKLSAGDTLIIPGVDSITYDGGGDAPIKKTRGVPAQEKYLGPHYSLIIPDYFINPVPGARLTQGLHSHNGVDLAIAYGTPIHASASGTVLFAKDGYNGGYGNLVIINHPNGTQTLYAHQSKLAVQTGQEVSQGEVIGYVGSTGLSTGNHLHFEVHGAVNPGADGSWAE